MSCASSGAAAEALGAIGGCRGLADFEHHGTAYLDAFDLIGTPQIPTNWKCALAFRF